MAVAQFLKYSYLEESDIWVRPNGSENNVNIMLPSGFQCNIRLNRHEELIVSMIDGKNIPFDVGIENSKSINLNINTPIDVISWLCGKPMADKKIEKLVSEISDLTKEIAKLRADLAKVN